MMVGKPDGHKIVLWERKDTNNWEKYGWRVEREGNDYSLIETYKFTSVDGRTTDVRCCSQKCFRVSAPTDKEEGEILLWLWENVLRKLRERTKKALDDFASLSKEYVQYLGEQEEAHACKRSED